MTWPLLRALRAASPDGSHEQMFGAKQQDPHREQCYQQATGSAARFLRHRQLGKTRYGAVLPDFHRPLVTREKNQECERSSERA